MVFHKLDLVDKRSERCLSLQRRVGHELLRKAACTFVKKCFKSSLFRDILSGTDNLQAQRVRIASKLLTSSFCDVRESTLDWIATESWTENEDSQILKLLQQRLFWDEEEAECLAKVGHRILFLSILHLLMLQRISCLPTVISFLGGGYFFHLTFQFAFEKAIYLL